MARAGIYKSEVVRARNNLLAVGRYPSIDAIRGELGNTGSKGTIHRYLKEIEEEEGGSTGAQVAVSEAIQDLAARLAERLHEEADQRLAALTDKHKAEIAALNDTITALRNEVESFRSQSERQAVELAAEKAAHTETLSPRFRKRESFGRKCLSVSWTWRGNRLRKKRTVYRWKKSTSMPERHWSISARRRRNNGSRTSGSSSSRFSSCRANCVQPRKR
jgi:hypothetical protein